MTQTTSITQSPHESLLNALQIAELGVDLIHHIDHEQDAAGCFPDIARLLRDALSKLGEPHPHTVELTRRYLEASWGRNVTDREAEDFVRVVVTSALKWEPV